MSRVGSPPQRRPRRAVVFGGANLDVTARAGTRADAGSSTPGSVTVCDGGVGRNIAENLARLGTPVALIAAFGADADGAALRERCTQVGIDTRHAVASAHPSSRYVAVLDEHGELVQGINDMRAIDSLTPGDIAPALADLSADDLVVADANLPVAVLTALARAAAAAGALLVAEPVSVAKAARLLELDPQPWLISPNADELAALAGALGPSARPSPCRSAVPSADSSAEASAEASGGAATPEAAAPAPTLPADQLAQAAALLDHGVAQVWVRLGALGSVVVSPAVHAPQLRATAARAVPVLDVTGGGDALLAGFVHAWIGGSSLPEAVDYAHDVAALTVAARHTVRPDLCTALVDRFRSRQGSA